MAQLPSGLRGRMRDSQSRAAPVTADQVQQPGDVGTIINDWLVMQSWMTDIPTAFALQ